MSQYMVILYERSRLFRLCCFAIISIVQQNSTNGRYRGPKYILIY